MSAFRKKPLVIEAVQWDGTAERFDELYAWGNPGGLPHTAIITYNTNGLKDRGPVGCSLSIDTAEGTMRAGIGDWVIRGVKGEFYPCKPDIFEATYEPAEREAPAEAAQGLAVEPSWSSADLQSNPSRRALWEACESAGTDMNGKWLSEAATETINRLRATTPGDSALMWGDPYTLGLERCVELASNCVALAGPNDADIDFVAWGKLAIARLRSAAGRGR